MSREPRPRHPFRRLAPAAVLAAVVTATGAAGAPVAGAATTKPPTTETRTTAKGKPKAKQARPTPKPGKSRQAKRRHGKAARRADASWLVVHSVGEAHSAAPERGTSELWTAISRDGRRLSRSRFRNADDPSASVEGWETTLISSGAVGDFEEPLAERVSPVYCMDEQPYFFGDAFYAPQRLVERQSLEQVAALQTDATARAALPAGPLIRGRRTVVFHFAGWQGSAPKFLWLDPMDFYLDAATGAVVRSGQPGADFWIDHTTWEATLEDDDTVAREVGPPTLVARQCDD